MYLCREVGHDVVVGHRQSFEIRRALHNHHISIVIQFRAAEAGHSARDGVHEDKKPKHQTAEEQSRRVTSCEYYPCTSISLSFWHPFGLYPG
jgi:hypothetical protein